MTAQGSWPALTSWPRNTLSCRGVLHCSSSIALFFCLCFILCTEDSVVVLDSSEVRDSSAIKFSLMPGTLVVLRVSFNRSSVHRCTLYRAGQHVRSCPGQRWSTSRPYTDNGENWPWRRSPKYRRSADAVFVPYRCAALITSWKQRWKEAHLVPVLQPKAGRSASSA